MRASTKISNFDRSKKFKAFSKDLLEDTTMALLNAQDTTSINHILRLLHLVLASLTIIYSFSMFAQRS